MLAGLRGHGQYFQLSSKTWLVLGHLPNSSVRGDVAPAADPLLKPRKVNDVDLLVSKLVLDAYASTPGAVGVDVVRKWIGGAA